MSGRRTPSTADGEKSPSKPGVVAPPDVRRSIGEWEAANHGPTLSYAEKPTEKTSQAGPAKSKIKPVLTQEGNAKIRKSGDRISPPKYADRTAEAKACLLKAKNHLESSRNTKTELKNGIIVATERLYSLVKMAELELKALRLKTASKVPGVAIEPEAVATNPTSPGNSVDTNKIMAAMEQHTKLLSENNKKIEELKGKMDIQNEFLEKGNTYASVAATQGARSLPKCSTLHSVVVTSKDETETGEEVLNRVRKAINAKDGWIKVEKVRKAKDRKIIIGLETREERSLIKDRLQKEGVDLTVEEVKNKDPLLILKNVLVVNTDEDVLNALRNQNRAVFGGLDSEDNRVDIKYRRRTRNPHIGHVIISVSPTIWRRAVEIGTVHIDLQRIRVEDQTPLVQCTRCLGFGHGKRFCKEPADLCGHCGGPHLRPECPDWLSGTPPACRNCAKGKIEYGTQHNAFSRDCPVRRKWDDVARSTVAYC